MVGLQIWCNLGFPFVAIAQQLLLIVEQLLVCLCREFKIRSLNNGIDGTGFLQEITQWIMVASFLDPRFLKLPDKSRNRCT